MGLILREYLYTSFWSLPKTVIANGLCEAISSLRIILRGPQSALSFWGFQYFRDDHPSAILQLRDATDVRFI
jgi:hypothetical protein